MSNRISQSLRNKPTAAEQKLWPKLRRRQIDGCKIRRQVPIGPFIVDFACLERKLLIEIDGGLHSERESYDA